jgi:glycosyltransferase involved in cell wall biosynthesis
MSLFSILIPTRNRSEYLRYALESVLAQSFKDLEVVVSDNASEDATREVVEKIKDARVKYVHTGKFINVGDNFSNAFRNSSGDYFILMGDDDYLMPFYLKEVFNCLSGHPDAEVFLSNTAQFDYRTGNLIFYSGDNISFWEEDKEKIIKRYFDFVAEPHNPTMGCFSRRLAERVAEGGRLYSGTFPDYSANFSMIIKSRKVFKTDLMTNITTVTEKSMCVKQFSTSIAARKMIFNQSPQSKSILTPIEDGYLHVNGMFQTLFSIKQRFPEETGRYEINREVYYLSVGREYVALTFKDCRGFDPSYFRKLLLFGFKIPFPVFLKFLFFHFPARILYGIAPLWFKDKTTDIFLKVKKCRTFAVNTYLKKDHRNLSTVKRKVMEYLRTLNYQA